MQAEGNLATKIQNISVLNARVSHVNLLCEKSMHITLQVLLIKDLLSEKEAVKVDISLDEISRSCSCEHFFLDFFTPRAAEPKKVDLLCCYYKKDKKQSSCGKCVTALDLLSRVEIGT